MRSGRPLGASLSDCCAYVFAHIYIPRKLTTYLPACLPTYMHSRHTRTPTQRHTDTDKHTGTATSTNTCTDACTDTYRHINTETQPNSHKQTRAHAHAHVHADTDADADADAQHARARMRSRARAHALTPMNVNNAPLSVQACRRLRHFMTCQYVVTAYVLLHNVMSCTHAPGVIMCMHQVRCRYGTCCRSRDRLSTHSRPGCQMHRPRYDPRREDAGGKAFVTDAKAARGLRNPSHRYPRAAATEHRSLHRLVH